MEIPEYVSKEEVQKICEKLGIRDWTKLTRAEVELKEAEKIRELVGGEALDVSVEEFQRGLEIELEHGIVLAHLKEMLDYYTRLEVAELEGDLLKALINGDQGKLAGKYQRLLEARYLLGEREKDQIDSA